jgi:hypothetical protein
MQNQQVEGAFCYSSGSSSAKHCGRLFINFEGDFSAVDL